MRQFMNKIILFFLVLISYTFIFPADNKASAQSCDFYSEPLTINVVADTEEEIAPCADTIVWKYVTISGVTYRRQYNVTTGEWIGVWEIAP